MTALLGKSPTILPDHVASPSGRGRPEAGRGDVWAKFEAVAAALRFVPLILTFSPGEKGLEMMRFPLLLHSRKM